MEQQMMILNLMMILFILIILFTILSGVIYLIIKNKLDNNKIELKKIDTQLTIAKLNKSRAEDERIASEAQLEFSKTFNDQEKKQYKSLGEAATLTVEEVSKGD